MKNQLARTVAGTFALILLIASTPLLGACFLRGDADADGLRELPDAIWILEYLFGRESEISCLDAADVDDDGRLTVTDGVFLLQHLFHRRPPSPFRQLPPPYRYCDLDPTTDTLSCRESAYCGTARCLVSDDRCVSLVIDRSDESVMKIAKNRASDILRQLGDGGEFTIVFVDDAVLRFADSEKPTVATPETRAAAIEWLRSVPEGTGSCIHAGFLAALQVSTHATVEPRSIIYFGDGSGTCRGLDGQTYLDQTHHAVTEANVGRVPIHAVGILVVGRMQRSFLEDLASRNGGEYVEVTR
jgi:hypothetical protein